MIEDGAWTASEVGAPQGASVSPLLANIYLHYVFDRWVRQWRRRHAHGDVSSCASPTTLWPGSSIEADAQRFLADLRERFAKFGLELHPDKTRLIEFGRYAARDRKARGVGKPETFDFLGFTHICGKTRNGRFWLKRITISKRMRAKLARGQRPTASDAGICPFPEQGRWLASVVRGHLAYYAVPGNSDAIGAFRNQVTRHWFRALRRRSQRTRLTWKRMDRLATRWLPPARILHPYPRCASTPAPKAGAQCGSPARWDLRGGPPARAVPTAIASSARRPVRHKRRPSPAPIGRSGAAGDRRRSLTGHRRGCGSSTVERSR